MDPVEFAVSLFNEGFNCSQALLASRSEELGLPRETALKIACGFGGGMGCTGEVCGALIGAILVLSLKYGTAEAKDKNTRYEVYRRVKELAQKFKNQAGSLYCRDLLGFDLNTPEGQAISKQPALLTIVLILSKLPLEYFDESLKER